MQWFYYLISKFDFLSLKAHFSGYNINNNFFHYEKIEKIDKKQRPTYEFFIPIKMDSGPSCSLLANISFISEVTLEFEVYSTDSSSPISKKMSGGMGAWHLS